MSTTTIDKPATLSRTGKPSKQAIAEAWVRSSGVVSTKPSRQVLAELWAKASGIINTGETDLSTREGLGY